MAGSAAESYKVCEIGSVRQTFQSGAGIKVLAFARLCNSLYVIVQLVLNSVCSKSTGNKFLGTLIGRA